MNGIRTWIILAAAVCIPYVISAVDKGTSAA